ncbi:YycC family protein [Bacillus sp. FSL K6-3149]|uniref:YycC family protein n=1 Tax=Bacillus sp. FSL K6-3149 TaxID=2921488 RepID=UPI00315B1380
MKEEGFAYETFTNLSRYSTKTCGITQCTIEQIMHMPQHILIAKLAELEQKKDRSS